MNLEDNLKFSLLTEFYGNLLTEKQRSILKDYFDNNISVSEIAKINNTTRQAVNDIIQRTSKVLLDYEEKLKLLSKFNLIKVDVKEILDLLKSKNFDKSEVETRLSKILEVI
jgi:predicted DNA-binding protein YlxM (UPF0122 family)